MSAGAGTAPNDKTTALSTPGSELKALTKLAGGAFAVQQVLEEQGGSLGHASGTLCPVEQLRDQAGQAAGQGGARLTPMRPM